MDCHTTFKERISPSSIGFSEDTFLLTPGRARSLRERLKEKKEAEVPTPDPEEPGRSPTSTQPDGREPEPVPQPTGEETPAARPEETIKRLQLHASASFSGKLYEVARGVFTPLTGEAGEFEFSIAFEVQSEEGISKRIVEQTVMATLRQLGPRSKR